MSSTITVGVVFRGSAQSGEIEHVRNGYGCYPGDVRMPAATENFFGNVDRVL